MTDNQEVQQNPEQQLTPEQQVIEQLKARGYQRWKENLYLPNSFYVTEADEFYNKCIELLHDDDPEREINITFLREYYSQHLNEMESMYIDLIMLLRYMVEVLFLLQFREQFYSEYNTLDPIISEFIAYKNNQGPSLDVCHTNFVENKRSALLSIFHQEEN